ncbi:MAG: RNA polymerase sigma factor [Lachnospiraceae bacterium]|nr:RNA polymerase sigma factor [Lachnospiraceae bacterium]
MLLCFMTLAYPEDRELFSRLYQEHLPLLLSRGQKLLGNQADAEDAVHDVFLRLMDSPERLRHLPDNEQKAFLLVCVQNQALDMLKKRKHMADFSYEEALAGQVYEAPDEPDDILRLTEAIARLPLQQQEILVLHYHLGLKYAEIGKLIGKKAGAVQRTVSRLRQNIGETMKGEAL